MLSGEEVFSTGAAVAPLASALASTALRELARAAGEALEAI